MHENQQKWYACDICSVAFRNEEKLKCHGNSVRHKRRVKRFTYFLKKEERSLKEAPFLGGDACHKQQ